MGNLPTKPSSPATSCDLTSDYISACRTDPAFSSFDSALQDRTLHTLTSLAQSGVTSTRDISLESLLDVTGCLLETNHETVELILSYKADVWKSPDLLSLVESFFDASLATLDFCSSLSSSLSSVRNSHIFLQLALRQFDADDHSAALDELRKFQTASAASPFNAAFFQSFSATRQKLKSMLTNLKTRRRRIAKKVKSLENCRKICNIVFAATFGAVLICSVVAAAIAAPPVAAALAAAMTVPVGSVGTWVGSLLKKHEESLRKEEKLLESMEVAGSIGVMDLNGILVMVEKLEVHMSAMMGNVDFALTDEEALCIGFEEIRKKLDIFTRSIDDLTNKVDVCSTYMQKARTVVLQKTIKHS